MERSWGRGFMKWDVVSAPGGWVYLSFLVVSRRLLGFRLEISTQTPGTEPSARKVLNWEMGRPQTAPSKSLHALET